MPTPAAATQYNPSIDGLRAIAVLAVIANHFSSTLFPSGFLGVDIFFVISGYVITQSMCSKDYTSFRHLISEFFSRRLKRLAPALIFFVAITSLTICFFNPNPGSTLKTGATALFGASNIFLTTQATDYFGDSAKLNAFTHTWSLGVEEQFYLAFPFIIWISGFVSPPYTQSKLTKILSALTAASFLIFLYLSLTSPKTAYFFMPARFWELAAGCLAFIWQNKASSTTITKISSWCTILLLCLLITQLLPESIIIISTPIAVILTALVLCTIKHNQTAYSTLSTQPIRYIGKISYSLYLWHWGVIVISKWTIGMHAWLIPVQLGAIALLSIISYHLIEAPLRHTPWARSHGGTLLKGGLASVICMAILVALIKPLDGYLYLGNQPSMVARGVDSLTDTYISPDGKSSWTADQCVLTSNSDTNKTIKAENCAIGAFESAKQRVLVLGNSYSAAFVHAFEGLTQNHSFSVVLTSSWGASPIFGLKNNSSWQEANNYYWSVVAPSLISRLKENDWVLLLSDLATLLPANSREEANHRIGIYKSNLKTLAQDLEAKKVNLAVLAPLPLVREVNCAPAATIPQWFTPFGGPCKFPSRADMANRIEDLNIALYDLQSKGHIKVINLFEIFCPNDRCTYIASNGDILYRDEWSHPSVEAAKLSMPAFEKVILSNKNSSLQAGTTP